METLVFGGPYVVDFTPPELTEGGGVWDGDYQSSTTLQADWSDIIDPESGIEECGYMIGKWIERETTLVQGMCVEI